MAVAAAGASAGFGKGVLGGSAISILALAAMSIAVPLEVAPVSDPQAPVLPPAQSQTVEDQSVNTAPATLPQVSEPQVPRAAPAVDPEIPQEEIALAPVEPILSDSAPLVRREPASSQPVAGAAPAQAPARAASPTASAGVSGTENPGRVDAGTQGVIATLSDGSGAISRQSLEPQVTITPSAPQPRQAFLAPQEPQRPAPSAPPSAPAAAAPPPPPAPAALPSAAVGSGSAPFEVFAASFGDTSNRPVMAVILADAGPEGIEISALSGLSFPVTFAVPSDLPDATERAAAYRAAGFEVMAMMPDGSNGDLRGLDAEGVEAQFARTLETVPEAIGILDRVNGDIPQDTNVSRRAVEILGRTGHALVTHRDQGFNSVDALAAVQNVPSATVFRVLDGDGNTAAVRDALDRAAVQARGTGGVVVLGRTDRETITTLFAWVLGSGGTQSVDLAPVSALMKKLNAAE